MRPTFGNVYERDPRVVGAGDPTRKLDTALGVGGAVDGDQDVTRELTPIRWTARHQHGDRGGMHGRRRGASQDNPCPAVVIAADDEQVYPGARIEQQARGILTSDSARARLDASLRRDRLGLLERTLD